MRRGLLVISAMLLCGCQDDSPPGATETATSEQVAFQEAVDFHGALLDRTLRESRGADLRRARPPTQKFYRFEADDREQITRRDLEDAVAVEDPYFPHLPDGVYGIILTGLSAVDDDGEVINTYLVPDDEDLATAEVTLSFVVADPSTGWVQYSAPLQLDHGTGEWRRSGPPEFVRRLRVPVE